MHTPIYTYREFLQQTTRALSATPHGQRTVAAVLVEFENLGGLDGILGYAMVDDLVSNAAARLARVLRESDAIGYTGRHQLCCLLTDLPGEAYAMLAGHKILRTLASPFQERDRRLVVSPRLGITVVDGANCTADELLRRANAAMRQARHEREALALYSGEGNDLQLLGIDLWTELGHAIEESEVFLVYQPQRSLASGRVEAVEALLRWTHPQRGPIRPDIMVRLAEGTELISNLTIWVLNTALRECAEWRSGGLDVGVSVNFSADNLRDPELVALVAQALDIWNVPAHCVQIEVTETTVMEEFRGSLDNLKRLKDIGLRISMDDFGTGYSSMARLRDLPLDEIKIDMSFIRGLTADASHERIVDSMIGLGHALGLRVVAEGVEDAPTCERLQALGCDVAQGFLIGMPMPLAQLMTALNASCAKSGSRTPAADAGHLRDHACPREASHRPCQ